MYNLTVLHMFIRKENKFIRKVSNFEELCRRGQESRKPAPEMQAKLLLHGEAWGWQHHASYY